MIVEMMPVRRLRPDPKNARKHGAANLSAIAASLSEFGQRRAAVVRADGTVLAGNGMLEAARSLGWDEIAVTVVPDDWSESRARAYALSDNRTGELAEWDIAILDEHLTELAIEGVDLEPFGFDDVAVAQLTGEKPADEDWKDAFGATSKDGSDFQQMTFVLHAEQVEVVKEAVAAAIAMGAFDSPNQNRNGNGLARICETFLTIAGGDHVR